MRRKRISQKKNALILLLCVSVLCVALPLSAWATSDNLETLETQETTTVPETTEATASGTGSAPCAICGGEDCTETHVYCDTCEVYDCDTHKTDKEIKSFGTDSLLSGLLEERASDDLQTKAVTWVDLPSTFTGGTLASGNYRLQQNFVLTSSIYIAPGSVVTIDLNHRMIEGNGVDPVIHVDATGTTNSAGSIISITSEGNLTIVDTGSYKNTVTGYVDTDGLWRRDVHLLGGKDNTAGLQKIVMENDGFIYNRGSGKGIMNRGTLTMTGGYIMGCESGADDTGAAICGTSTAKIILNGVTVQYNRTTRVHSDEAQTNISWGGVVHCEKDYFDLNAHLEATGCTIRYNQSVSKGGGVSGGKITLKDCIITNNRAAYGGGVDACQNLTISGGTISDNIADVNGGGVFGEASDALVQISGTTISNNTASSGHGGGAYVVGTLTITNGTTIDNNTATNGNGGGAYSGGNMTVTDSTISNNKAIRTTTSDSIGRGGGLYTKGVLTVNGTSKIYKNSADFWGGGIYTEGQNINHYITDSANIEANTAKSNGGGIYCNGILNLQGSAIFQLNEADVSGGAAYAAYINMSSANVQILNNTAKEHGGGLAATFSMNITAGTVKGNQASSGGGVMRIGANQGTTSTISGCIIEENHATQNGGGVYVGIYEMTIGDAIIRNNTAGDNGGGVFVGKYGTTPGSVVLDGTPITGNTADDYGGGVYAVAEGQITAKNGTTIDSNSATLGNGGGIYATLVTITGSTVSNNKAAAEQPNSATIGRGGGICARDRAVVTVTDSTITGNQASVQGGGIWVGLNTTVTIDNSTVSSNKTLTSALGSANTEGSGGGIYAKTVLTVTNGSVISGNESAWCGGGIFTTEAAEVMIEGGSSVTGNTSANNGGGIYTNGTLTVQTGTSFANNSAHVGGAIYGADVVIEGTESSRIRIENNTAATSGGGVFVTKTADIDYALIQNNKAEADSGGGLVCYENCTSFSVTNSEILGNTATVDGGGMLILGTATVSDCNVTGNRAGIYGGGVHVANTGSMTMSDTTVNNNDAIEMVTTPLTKANSGRGGGVSVMGTATFDNVTITGNRVLRYGGGLHISENGEATWNSGTIEGNTALLDGAGGVHAEKGTLTIVDATITGNVADEVGGGIHINNATLTIRKATITNNTVNAGGGGGIHANVGATLNIHDGIEISGNKAYSNARVSSVTMAGNEPGAAATLTRDGAAGIGNGGGLCVAGATVTMEGGVITNNQASGNGGGIAVRDLVYEGIHYAASLNMISGSVINNTSEILGGGIYATGEKTTVVIGVENCAGTGDNHTVAPTNKTHPIITGNTAADSGGGLAMENGATVTVYCSELADNTAMNAGRGNNVYSDGQSLTLYNVDLGTAAQPGLVAVNGTVQRENTSAGVILKYYRTNAADTPDKTAQISENEVFHLPDAEKYWSESGVFMGWTFHGPAYESAPYVRDSSQYMPVGMPLTAADATDGHTGDSTVHMYALWAPQTSTITYYGSIVDDVFREEALATNSNNPTTYTFTDDSNAVTLKEPVKAGYTFVGWYVYQNADQNANWGYEPEAMHYFAKNVPLELGNSHFGDITLIPRFTENTVTYTYHFVGPQGVTGFGSFAVGGTTETDGYTYTIKTDSGTPKVVTAEAAHRYQFLGWYADAACTQEVTTAKALEVQKTDGLYTGGTFYAKFDYHLDDLTIVCTDTSGYFKDQQHFIYEVWCGDAYVTTVVLQDGESVVVRDLVIGENYTVKLIENWSWRFVSGTAEAIQTVKLTQGGSSVTFRSAQQRHIWLTHDTHDWFGKTSNG